MEAFAIVVIVFGSVIAACIILGCLCGGVDKNKKQTRPPNSIGMQSLNGTTLSAQQPNQAEADLERGEGTKKSSGTKDGGMVILGAGAALATTAVVTSTTSGCGGGGGCGGACGGCGGGCGGCGG